MSGSEDIFEKAYEKIKINIQNIERIKRENTDFFGRKHYEYQREFINEMKQMIHITYVVMKTISKHHVQQNPDIFKRNLQTPVDTTYIHHDIHSTIYTLFKYFPENFNKILQSVIIDLYHSQKPKIDFYNVMLVYLIFFLEGFQLEQKLFYMEFVCNTFGSAALFSPSVKFQLYSLYATKHIKIKTKLEQTGHLPTNMNLDCMIPFNNTLDSTSISEAEAVRMGAPPDPEDKRTPDQKRKAEDDNKDREKRLRMSMSSRRIPDSYVQMVEHDRNQVNREIIELLNDLPQNIDSNFFEIQQPRGGKSKRQRKITKRHKRKSKKTKKRATKYK